MHAGAVFVHVRILLLRAARLADIPVRGPMAILAGRQHDLSIVCCEAVCEIYENLCRIPILGLNLRRSLARTRRLYYREQRIAPR